MKKTVSQTILAVFAFLLSSCASHKKFDFKNAYKFDRINYDQSSSVPTIQEVTTNTEEIEANILASNNTLTDMDPVAPNTINTSNRSTMMSSAHQEREHDVMQTSEEMTKTVKNEFKKDLRKTIRDIKNENLNKVDLMASIEGGTDVQDDGNSQKKRKIARYLLIGGGALVIIAVIVGSVSVVGTIGIVAVIAGAVLMLLSLDK